MIRRFAQAALAATTLLALAMPAQAQQISPTLKKMLSELPLNEYKDDVQKSVGALKQTSCGGGLQGCYMAKSGVVKLYFFTSSSAQQTFLVAFDTKMKLPKLLKDNVQKFLGGTQLSDPIISISTTDFKLANTAMPSNLQQIVRDSYFNASGLEFAAGVQVMGRANLGGAMRAAILALGAKADELTMRAAVVMPIPTDLVGGAGAGAGLADALAHSDTMKKAAADALSPEAFVEFQLGPKSEALLKAPVMVLNDMTFFINNAGTFGYKGNARYISSTKNFLIQFQTPLNPAGALDLLDFSFRMGMPASFTLEDFAQMAMAMAVPPGALQDPAAGAMLQYGGGFIRNIKDFAKPLGQAVKPLSVFKIANPNPPAPYQVGDPTKPFPTDDRPFNVFLFGPTAQGGPAMHVAGNVVILGQTMGKLDITAGPTGLHGMVEENISIRLGPLGNTRIRMTARADISGTQQDISMVGNLAGQRLSLVMAGDKLNIDFSASCVNPFKIDAEVKITPSLNLADIMQGQGGVNVDPSKIQGCIGKELEAAYNKIANEYKEMGGFTAKDAKAALKAINNEYQRVKTEARDAANKSANAAVSAFNDAGNALKTLGKKKKHKKGPDPRFASSVFDWDYYYDRYDDLVAAKVDLHTHWRDNGFREMRQGSPEFHAKYYRTRYIDVQEACPNANDADCIVKHWLDKGIESGRQGSPEVSVASYLKRNPSLQTQFGREGYFDAMEHWLNDGTDQNLNASPESSSNGPIYGPELVGGDGGGLWTDFDTCNGKYVTGFRLRHNKEVYTVQFEYGSKGWAPEHGERSNGRFDTEVNLASDEYITRIDYRGYARVDQLTFYSNKNKKYGPYGGTGGGPGTYRASPGERLACVAGRAGSLLDRLIFTSTGLR